MPTETPTDHLLSHLLSVSRELKASLAGRDCPSFHLDIAISGRADDQSTLVRFELSKDGYNEMVKGANLSSVRDEFLRRFTWRSRNPEQLLTDERGALEQ